MIKLSNGMQELYQYDTDVFVIVEDDCDEIHFSNLPYGKSVNSKVENGIAQVPNELITNKGNLYCYGFVGEDGEGHTIWERKFKINQRPRTTKKTAKAILGQAKLGNMIL